MTRKQTDEFWSTDDAEELLSHTLDFALTEWLQGYWGPGAGADGSPHQFFPLPRTVTVYRWRRDTLPEGYVRTDCILERLAEWLDDEYGGPDEPSKLSDRITNAAWGLVDAVYADYVPWTCRVAGSEDVDVKEWLEHDGMDSTDIEWADE